MSEIFNRFDSAPETLVAGIRRNHSMTEAQTTVPRQWAEFWDLGLQEADGRRAFGAYCSMSAEGFEYMTGVEVEDFEDLPSGIGRMRIPAQQYAVFAHTENVSNIGRTWQQIWRNWLPESGFEDAHTPPFELYDERFDPDTGEGGLEVWFPVREVKERDEKTTQ